MEVRLLSHTPEIERLVYTAARTCYSDMKPTEIWDNSLVQKEQALLVKKIVESGHHSVLEHVVFSFEVSGISRAASHQLVRHCLASYSQQSQRYVVARNGFSFVVPPSFAEHPELHQKYHTIMAQLHQWYTEFLDIGVKGEDARFILPNGSAITCILSMV